MKYGNFGLTLRSSNSLAAGRRNESESLSSVSRAIWRCCYLLPDDRASIFRAKAKAEAAAAMFQFLEGWHNPHRLHSDPDGSIESLPRHCLSDMCTTYLFCN